MKEKLCEKNINEVNVGLLFKNNPEFLQIASSAIEKTEGEINYFSNDGGESYFTTYDMYYKGIPPIDGSYGGIKISKEEYDKQLLNTSKKLYSNYLNTLSLDEPSVESFKYFVSNINKNLEKQENVYRITEEKTIKKELRTLPHLEMQSEEGKNGDVGLHIKGIENYPVLSGEEEKELAKKIKGGDETARNKFVLSNLKLVLSIMKNYKKQISNNSVITSQDIFQEGMVGLLKAVEKFDWRKEFRFSTYATWWIKMYIAKFMDSYGRRNSFRLPAHMEELLHRYWNVYKKLEQKLQRPATSDEIAQEMGIEEDVVNILTEINNSNNVSLDKKVSKNDEDSSDLSDLLFDPEAIKPDDYTQKRIVTKIINKAMIENGFSERDSQILNMRFGLKDSNSHTLKEVGEKFGISKERIRQIENKLLFTLGSDENIKSLKEDLD